MKSKNISQPSFICLTHNGARRTNSDIMKKNLAKQDSFSV